MNTVLELPTEMLYKILGYVPPDERQPLASACTRFAEILEIPSFWQHQQFDFEGEQFTQSQSRELKYTCRFQSQWKHLDLKFGGLTKKATERFKKWAALICKEFNDIWTLESLTLTFDRKWHSEVNKRNFVMNFYPIFYYQSCLTEVSISMLQVSQFQGCKILRVLLDGCGSTITTLRLVDFFRSYRYNAHLFDDFDLEVTSFVNLHHLELNYSYVSAALLHLLAIRFPGLLETLTLRKSTTDLTHDPKLSQACTVLNLACPKLIISHKID